MSDITENGLIILKNNTQRKGNILRKKIHWFFNKFSFALELQTNITINKQINKVYLDSTQGTFKKGFTTIKPALYMPNTRIVLHFLSSKQRSCRYCYIDALHGR